MRSLKEIMAGLPWARRCAIEKRADELARLIELEEELEDMHKVRLALYAERDALKAQIADLQSAIDSRDIALGFTEITADSATHRENDSHD